jgi:hypothetical protein
MIGTETHSNEKVDVEDHLLEEGNKIYFHETHFKKLLSKLMFWKKKPAYIVTEVDSESSFTFERVE